MNGCPSRRPATPADCTLLLEQRAQARPLLRSALVPRLALLAPAQAPRHDEEERSPKSGTPHGARLASAQAAETGVRKSSRRQPSPSGRGGPSTVDARCLQGWLRSEGKSKRWAGGRSTPAGFDSVLRLGSAACRQVALPGSLPVSLSVATDQLWPNASTRTP